MRLISVDGILDIAGGRDGMERIDLSLCADAALATGR
jgi:hypothetical protein